VYLRKNETVFFFRYRSNLWNHYNKMSASDAVPVTDVQGDGRWQSMVSILYWEILIGYVILKPIYIFCSYKGF